MIFQRLRKERNLRFRQIPDMKSVVFLFLLFVTGIASAFSQRSEIGFFAGTSYYLGDLNPNKHFGNSRPAAGIVYRYNFTTRWALKINGLIGSVVGDDASSVGADKQRNLSFRSKMLDFSSQLELNFFHYYTGSGKYYFSPYIFTGLSLFNFKPQAEYGGEWFDLQSLDTEGQGTSQYPERSSYRLTQLAIPFGIGVKLSISKHFCLGAEWGMRRTSTDYLDDVSETYPDQVILEQERGMISAGLSDRTIPVNGVQTDKTGMQRGDPGNKDWYSFAGITFTAKLYTKKQKGCRDLRKQSHPQDFLFD